MTEPQTDQRRRFAMVPEDLLFDPDVPAEAVRVFGVLHRYGSTPETCYPSLARIAEHVGSSPRSVRRWIGILEQRGWLRRIARKTTRGDADSNAYLLFPQRGGTDTSVPTPGQESPHPRSDVSPPPDTRDPTPGQSGPEGTDTGVRLKRASEREPLNESARRADAQGAPLNPPMASVTDISTREDRSGGLEFSDFWALWPQKRSRKDAEKAWNQALARGVKASTMVEGARSWLADPSLNRGYVPYGASWIRGDRWEDEPLIPKTDDAAAGGRRPAAPHGVSLTASEKW